MLLLFLLVFVIASLGNETKLEFRWVGVLVFEVSTVYVLFVRVIVVSIDRRAKPADQ